jgi:hypothetical protein
MFPFVPKSKEQREEEKVPKSEATLLDYLMDNVKYPIQSEPPYEPHLNEEGKARRDASINEGKEHSKAIKETREKLKKALSPKTQTNQKER